MKNKLVHIFFDTDMRLSFKGLLAKLHEKTDKELKKGDFVLFLNKRQDMLKMFCSSTNCLLHFKVPRGKIDSRTVVDLPNYVQGNSLDYNSALKKVLAKRLGKKSVNIKRIKV